MSEDRFDHDLPKIEYDREELSELFFLGGESEGILTFRSVNDVVIRGVIYSSNPYVTLLNPQFEGVEVAARFSVNLKEPKETDVIKGVFTVVANRYEHAVPYTIRFDKKPLYAAETEISTLSDFAALAKDNMPQAMRLFYADSFAAFIEEKTEDNIRRLYRGYRHAKLSPQNLDEFFISAKEKTRADFSLNEEDRRYFEVAENIKDTIDITRDAWGYIEIDIAVNADFITIEKEKLTPDYFLGSAVRLNYYVHADRLHAGLNYAKITFDSLTSHKEISIVASNEPEHSANHLPHLHYEKLMSEFTDIYRDFRLHHMKSADFAARSIELLDELQKFDDDREQNGRGIFVPKKNEWYLLMKAQALIVDRKEEDALWIIQDLKKDIEDKRSAAWAYLLYLCTLIEPEEDYINRLTDEIEKIFAENQDDVRIFWFLLFLREPYIGNAARKLKDIAQWVMQGENSPYLYIEAFYLYQQEPFLLKGFSPFETRLLLWAVHRGVITRDLSLQIAALLENEKTFRKDVFSIAEAAFRLFPEEELFMQTLAYLLKTQQYGQKYLPWFESAVIKEVRLTGLYEAYLLSLPENYAEQLPELVTLYFRYQSNLSYQKKAFVYANVVNYRKAAPQVYEQYLRSIENFALEQMRLRRIDDNLSILYQIILDIGLISEDVADAMAELLFTKKLGCLYEGIRRVHVYEDFREKPLILPVDDGVAYVPLYTNEYKIFLEDDEGRLFSEDGAYHLEELLNYSACYEQLKKQANNKLPYIVHDFSLSRENGLFKKEDLSYVESFLDSDTISRSYRGKLYPELIGFLQSFGREDMIEKHLLYKEPYDLLSGNLFTYMIEISIENGLYDKAYELSQRFFALSVDERLLQKLCAHLTDDKEAPADDFLIALTAYLMQKNMFTESMVSYLNRVFVGPSPVMNLLCRLTDEYHLKAESLYERTLIQMLYTENVTKDSGEVFIHYLDHNPNKMVIEAYLTYEARAYIHGETEIPDIVFSELLRYYLRDTKLNESCRIALMKRLSTGEEMNRAEFEALDELINDFIIRNIYFAFYKSADRRLIIKYHLYDKTFLEYAGEPGVKLSIRYKRESETTFSTDEMIEMYEGIYVHEFVLFFGDALDYEIYENESEVIVRSGSVSYNELSDDRESSRFVRLNRMQSLIVYGEEEKLIEDMKEYRSTDEAAEKLLTVI